MYILPRPDGRTFIVNAHIDLRSKEDRTVTIIRSSKGKRYATIDVIPDFEVIEQYHV